MSKIDKRKSLREDYYTLRPPTDYSGIRGKGLKRDPIKAQDDYPYGDDGKLKYGEPHKHGGTPTGAEPLYTFLTPKNIQSDDDRFANDEEEYFTDDVSDDSVDEAGGLPLDTIKANSGGSAQGGTTAGSPGENSRSWKGSDRDTEFPEEYFSEDDQEDHAEIKLNDPFSDVELFATSTLPSDIMRMTGAKFSHFPVSALNISRGVIGLRDDSEVSDDGAWDSILSILDSLSLEK